MKILGEVYALVLARLAAATKGMVVVAIDGLSWPVAAECMTHATVEPARSVFPTTSASAWLTAVTGRDVSEHGVVGAAYRVPGTNRIINVITGAPVQPWAESRVEDPAGDLAWDWVRGDLPTIFDGARDLGVWTLAYGPELAQLRGPWVQALLHGAELLPVRGERPLSTNPAAVVDRLVEEVTESLRAARGRGLLWAYLNLDDHVHKAGYDALLRDAVRAVDLAARRWADAGWVVLAHADHGQTPIETRPELHRAWGELESPEFCRAPAGGAGRVRWLYPRIDRRDQVARLLPEAMGEHALVLSLDELAERGLVRPVPAVRERIGEVCAIATSPAFPVPDPSVTHEHGALTDAELLVPLATWREP